MHQVYVVSLVLSASAINCLPVPSLNSLLPRIGGSGAGSAGAAGTMGMYAGFTPPVLPTLTTSSGQAGYTLPAYDFPVNTVQTGGTNDVDSRDLLPRLIDTITQHLERRELPRGPDGARGADGPDGVAYPNPGATTPSTPAPIAPIGLVQPGSSEPGHVGSVGTATSLGFIQPS